MMRHNKTLLIVALLSVTLVADAQFFGTARRVVSLVASTSLESEGTLVVGTTLTVGGLDLTPTSGTFEAVWAAGCTASPSQTWDFVEQGNRVTLYAVDGVSCTSDDGFLTAAGAVPSAVRAAYSQVYRVHVFDNGTGEDGCLIITSSGTMILRRLSSGICTNNIWTNSGLKGMNAVSEQGPNTFTYHLTNPS